MNKQSKPDGKMLTLAELNKIYKDLPPSDDMVIKWWQYPFLWVLYVIKGQVITSEHWTMYFVDFNGVRYLIKSKYDH